jgi:hypothetical protein
MSVGAIFICMDVQFIALLLFHGVGVLPSGSEEARLPVD